MYLDNDKMFGDLLNKRVKAVHFPDDTNLVLTMEDDTVARFVVEGGCCSSSYFYHQDDFRPEGKILRAVRDLPMPYYNGDEDEKIGYTPECIQLYGYSFEYDGGSTILEFRNSSNGWYSGWMERVR